MSQSAFDDLLNLGGSADNSNQSSDPFDPLGSNQNSTNSGGALLDLGFDAQVSTENVQSGSVEVNTNPLYEFTKSNNSLDIMANETDNNALLDFGSEPQKEIKSDPSTNPLYDFIESENTNGHADDFLTNGDNDQTVDLLDNSTDLLGGPVTVTSDDSGVTMDANNISDSQREDETAEDNLEVEVEKIVEEEEVQDEDTSNIDEIGSEQITEPDVEDQLEEQEGQMGLDKNDVEPEPVEDQVPEAEKQDNEDDVKEAANDGTDLEETGKNGANIIQSENAGTVEDNVKAEKTDVEEPDLEEKAEVEILESQGESGQEEPLSVEGEIAVTDTVTTDQDIQLEQQTASLETNKTETQEEATDTKIQGVEHTEENSVPIDSAPEQVEEVNDSNVESEKPEVEQATAKEESDNITQVEELVEKESAPNVETIPVQNDIVQEDESQQEKKPEDVKEFESTDNLEKEPETVIVPEPENVDEPLSEMEPVPEELNEQNEDQEPVTEESSSPTMIAKDEPVQVEPETAEPDVETKLAEPNEAETTLDSPETTAAEVNESPLDEPVSKENMDPENHGLGDEDKKKKEEVHEVKPTDTKKPETEENAVKVNGTNDVKEDGVVNDEVRFAEMNNVRQKFESGTVKEDEPTLKKVSVREEYDEGGEFENTPAVNEDVVKETDQQKEELPEIGMAKNLLNRFQSLQEESAQVVTSQKRVSPPRNEKVEYENQPEERNIVYESKSDEGVFESTPKQEDEDVVRSGDKVDDVQVEKGYTKNVLSKFKEIETESSAYKAREKRELTPDKSGKVEYVSEPRGEHITYDESKTETGVYENVPQEEEDVVRSADKTEEVMPESGMAKNLLSKFKQLESETVNYPPPSPKRGTPYEPKPKEQKGYLERFSPKLEEGEFENEPVIPKEVVRSGDTQEDVKPETGTAKKALERFKEMEQQGSSPKAPDYRKDFTPPREASPGKTVSGVLENEPVNRPDVVRNADRTADELPEQGTAKNILEKFKQIQSAENSPSSSPTKKYKEFTPPPESGVYENAPKEHLVIEQRQSEVGVLESTPGKSVADIPREQREAVSPEQELPEKGMAKNLVSKFKQLESESAKSSKSESPSKYKEFTPPRDTRNILSPKSPAEHQNGVHPSDLPEQYQEQTSPGIFESTPETRPDVYRETDTDWEQGLPAKNTTMSMLEKFRSIQQKAKEDEEVPTPVSRKGKNVQHE